MARRTLLLAGATLAATGRTAFAQTTTLRVVAPAIDGVKAAYYGAHAGVFRKYGLTVETSFLNSGAAATAALVGGAADIAFSNVVSVIAAFNKSIPIQVIAPGPTLSPGMTAISGLVVLKDSPVANGRDLAGKTVGVVALGDSSAAAVQAWIDQSGGDAKTVRLIEAPGSSAVALLEAGRVNAMYVNEPAMSQAVESGAVRVIANPLVSIAKTWLVALYAVMAPAAEKRPQLMRDFARAMHEASAYTNAHPADTVEMVATYTGIPAAVVAHSVRYTDAEYVEAAAMQPVIDVMARYGLTDRAFPAAGLISPYALRR